MTTNKTNHTLRQNSEKKPSEDYCKALVDKDAEIPEECKTYASVKAHVTAQIKKTFKYRNDIVRYIEGTDFPFVIESTRMITSSRRTIKWENH